VGHVIHLTAHLAALGSSWGCLFQCKHRRRYLSLDLVRLPIPLASHSSHQNYLPTDFTNAVPGHARSEVVAMERLFDEARHKRRNAERVFTSRVTNGTL